ncbi:HesB/YadR/YfhF family protein [Shouchella shacheensis]|uniref:HesB/YadR/YfhF family protein n=1 Tax=Shouchella shacheensis TaxID=1649580 RepID=UPI00073FFC0B|nr:HesB/YadR/YfhF family protein [Shouchella shacheensis]
MEIEVTKPALRWFKEEFGEEDEKVSIRFFGRYGGCGSLQSGFSIGMEMQEPEKPVAVKEMDGFMFFIEKQDLWYFNNHSVKIKYSRTNDEIEFDYKNA